MSTLSTLEPPATREVAPPPNGPVIEIAHLQVAYGPVQAVKNVSLQVQPGEIFGLLGPNGAGKTTTLSAIEGLIRPQAGPVRVLGLDVWPEPDRVQRHLGISLQS